MWMLRIGVWVGLVLLVTGCASPVLNPDAAGTVIVVPGIGGEDASYDNVCRALAVAGNEDRIEVFDWGYHWPLFFINISCGDLHHQTEKKLAQYIEDRLRKNPRGNIALIGHSAGAGVIVGALGRLDPSYSVGPVVLLAPALSPDHDLAPALQHCQSIHVFYSADDDFWQGAAPFVLGEYDGVHRSGAGRRGFSLAGLDPAEQARVIQLSPDKQWESLGVHGGHFDWLAPAFVAKILEPLVGANHERISAAYPTTAIR